MTSRTLSPRIPKSRFRTQGNVSKWFILPYNFHWFAFPAFVAKPTWEIGDEGWANAVDLLGQDDVRSPLVVGITVDTDPSTLACFNRFPTSRLYLSYGQTRQAWRLLLLKIMRRSMLQYLLPRQVLPTNALIHSYDISQQFVAFVDPSANPGWPLHNTIYVRVRQEVIKVVPDSMLILH